MEPTISEIKVSPPIRTRLSLKEPPRPHEGNDHNCHHVARLHWLPDLSSRLIYIFTRLTVSPLFHFCTSTNFSSLRESENEKEGGRGRERER